MGGDGRKTMLEHRIIQRLWSAVYDLLLYNKGQSNKTLEEIEMELNVIESECRRIDIWT